MIYDSSVYVHIPFCERKCGYCSFYSAPSDEKTRTAYAKALCRSIETYRTMHLECPSVYFGGGTPTVMENESLISVLSKIKNVFELDDDTEITIEANPKTVDIRKLTELREAGFNRISFGVQSLIDEELAALGRIHTAEDALAAVNDALKAGFDNISCDMMIGIPKQSTGSMLYTADRLSELPISHISAYMLSVESGTPFYEMGVDTDDDVQANMYLDLCERLAENGFEHYEISNFARDGRVSKHNTRYWKREYYLGFGASAHSFFDHERRSCDDDTQQYIMRQTQQDTVNEVFPDELEEYIMLGLRLSEGILFNGLRMYGASEETVSEIRKKAEELAGYGLCRVTEKNISLTDSGFLGSNAVIGEFLNLC
ncbi:MAG: radical SAM family heme chaperone HemW [Ruminococcus sp.]|nr:radical SAM family heme chaperone HemW [Ruminococcus sp.]